MELNDKGRIVQKCWLDLPNHYKNCKLHAFVIMPNHIHGIIEIVGNGFKPFQNEPPTEKSKMNQQPTKGTVLNRSLRMVYLRLYVDLKHFHQKILIKNQNINLHGKNHSTTTLSATMQN